MNFSEYGEVLLNHTFEKVISQFNGENTIRDVIKYIMKVYVSAPEELVSKDIVGIVKKLTEWQGISWNGENPFLNNKNYEIEKDTIIMNPIFIDNFFNERTILEPSVGKQVIFNIKKINSYVE